MKTPDGFQPGLFPCPCGKVHPVPTKETMKSFQATQKRVPWGKDRKGQHVYTNGIMEDALGLSPWINGWGGEHGYYVDPDKAEIATHIVESIDWQRVHEMDQFTTPFNQGDTGWMMFGEQLLLNHKLWCALLKKCFKSVPRSEFDAAVASAWLERERRAKNYLVTTRKHGRKNGELLRRNIRAVNPKDAKNIAFSKWTHEDKVSVGWIKHMKVRVIK